MAPIEYADGCELNVAAETLMNCEKEKPLAMSYVPYQEFVDLYDDDKALYKGTLFKKLDLPFLGRRVMR